MSNEVVTLKVRVSPEFREKITNTAKENNRSMNQEIVSRLEKSFESQDLKNIQTITLIMELVERFPKETFTLNLSDELRNDLLKQQEKFETKHKP